MTVPYDDAPASAARDSDKLATEADGDMDTIAARTVTINKPREEVYAFYRNFPNLTAVMDNVESITMKGEDTAHWVVKAPAGKTVEWDAIVTEDQPGRLIAWKSAEGADVDNSGRVEFLDAAPGRGTIVRATIAYDPPGGVIGEWIAKFLQKEPNVQVRRDLRRLKQYLETGEVTTSASPSGRKSEDPTKQYL
jgi:uncharacterized membrane protein